MVRASSVFWSNREQQLGYTEIYNFITVGVAAWCRLIAAFLNLLGTCFEAVADAAVHVGDPEISTVSAAICVGLFFSGHYAKAVLAFLVFCAADVFLRDPVNAAFLGAGF